ncbi:MAG: hypothetical protein AAF799_39145 [Myxococcota bacterium]
MAEQRDRVVVLVLVLGVIAMLGIRLHVLDDEFPNPDIAGIAYNAELILDGGRPYLETVEIKPPGAFLLTAASFSVLGRTLEALQLFHFLWLCVGAVGVWWAAMAIHHDDEQPQLGPRCAAIGVAVYLVGAAMFSYNYSSWMTPAYALAVGATLRGMKRDSRWHHVLAGAAALAAVLIIQRAAVLALVMPGLWLWARRQQWPGVHPKLWAQWLGGALLVGVPLVLWFGVGEARVLFDAVVPIGVGADYAASADGSALGSLAAAIPQLGREFWWPAALVGVAAVATFMERERDLGAWFPGLLWLAASIVGAGLGGGRYYLHYLVQYAPALALLAASPALVRAGQAAARDSDEPGRVRARILVAVAALLSVAQLGEIGLGQGHRYESMARRLKDGKTAAQAAGAHIRAQTTEDDTILAWGWTAWRVYYWAQRRSATRVYKPLGSLTTFNTNTAFDPGEGIVFRDGPLAAQVLAEFDRHPPAYIVYSPSMVQAFGAKREPLEDFAGLRDRIALGYVPEAQFGDLRLLRRRPVPR